MPEAVVFDDEAQARAAFGLGGSNLTFRCNVCKRTHRYGSRDSYKCFSYLKNRIGVYKLNMFMPDLEVPSVENVWSYWGRERETAEFFALKDYVREVLRFNSKSDEPMYHMLALTDEAVKRIKDRNFSAACREFDERLGAHFRRIFARLLGVACELRNAKAPNLPFPFAVDFKRQAIFFEDKPPYSFESFFLPRVARVVEAMDLGIADFSFDPGLARRVFREMTSMFGLWHNALVGYFVSGGVYLMVCHGGIYETMRGHYEATGHFVFFLRDYERPELVEVFLERDYSSEQMISKLKELAKAA